MVYKCLNGLAPNYLESKMVKRSTIHYYNTRHKDHIEITFERTSIAQRSFFDGALTSWNELSEELKNCTNLISFKRPCSKRNIVLPTV